MNVVRLVAIWLTLGAGVFPGLWAPPVWGEQAGMNLSPADKQLLLASGPRQYCRPAAGEGRHPGEGLISRAGGIRGAFVSLHRRGQLRGCIGYIEAVKPLLQTVMEMAPAAAFQDPRFRPVQADELADLEIEISVLTPMRLIKSPDEIEVGKHGLYIVKGQNRGLLLPQVASQYHWDRQTFLEQTCHKAGLPSNAWEDSDYPDLYFPGGDFCRSSPQKLAAGLR